MTLQLSKNQLMVAGVGFGLGVLWLVIMRALLAYPEPVHYHANFAVFINGQREQFDGFGYYEEITACSEDGAVNPKGRVHMHAPDNDVIHVHDSGVTWGQFFEVIRWSINDNALVALNDVYIDGQGGELTFILNGQRVPDPSNLIIGSEDRLLVSFGANDDTQAQYEQIAATAGEFNAKDDPAACSGSQDPSLLNRLKHAIFG